MSGYWEGMYGNEKKGNTDFIEGIIAGLEFCAGWYGGIRVIGELNSYLELQFFKRCTGTICFKNLIHLAKLCRNIPYLPYYPLIILTAFSICTPLLSCYCLYPWSANL